MIMSVGQAKLSAYECGKLLMLLDHTREESLAGRKAMAVQQFA